MTISLRAPSDGRTSASPPDKRLAIIGGGMGGVATAWFCDVEWSISLFEAKRNIGGNCDSETIDHHGREVVVDLGAQFFHPETHPTYIALLELLDRLDRIRAGQDARKFEIPAHLCVLPLDGGNPRFTSRRPLRTPRHALDFAIYSQAARKMASSGAYDVTIADWVGDLNVSDVFKTRILLPWLTASEGHPLEDTKRSSARAILQLFAPSHPRKVLERATTWSSRAGLQRNIMTLAEQCKNTRIHTQSPILRIEKTEDGWFVHAANSRSGPFDALVINAPPWQSKKLIDRLPWTEALLNILDRYEHRSHRLTAHTDPIYVHKNRKSWGLANVGVGTGTRKSGGDGPDERSELSIWLGAALERTNGKTVDVFKSWATYRGHEPKELIAERTFQHSIKTPHMMDAARQLRDWQGKEALWFAGQFTSGIDLQESALCSAMDIGNALCPSSPNLAALKSRIALGPVRTR